MKFFQNTTSSQNEREILKKMLPSNELLALEPLFWGSVVYNSLAHTLILETGNRSEMLILYKI